MRKVDMTEMRAVEAGQAAPLDFGAFIIYPNQKKFTLHIPFLNGYLSFNWEGDEGDFKLEFHEDPYGEKVGARDFSINFNKLFRILGA